MSQSKYVVIEGNDGTGKSTQVELLAEYLAGRNIESYVMHEPAGTPIADAIREVIKNGELERDAYTNLLLFTAARHETWHAASAALEAGKWVLSARNFLSTEVYQGYAEGIDVAEIHKITREFTSDRYMSPDHALILTLSDDIRKTRIDKRGDIKHKDTFESRDESFQQKLNEGYHTLAKKYGYTTIDANQSIESIHATIRKYIDI